MRITTLPLQPRFLASLDKHYDKLMEVAGGQSFLSQRTEPSRQTHTAHGSDASAQVSPCARSRPSYTQPAGKPYET
ncbi:hypothetical protein EYF80_025898 [Liparis tanakae]|uniref:Uncharacterized protein n=1 Tax=Liparis tanakae TaxID=230148 RepID=A0A4Z2HG53_9TELE|nr:hypothetical protein EYF80_025898 [Liparis tanakae]